MREVVICEPVRTPIGRYGGALKALSAAELGERALRGLLVRTGLDPEAVDDVVLGHCYPNSEAPAIGRVVALNAGLPVTVPGMQVDRRCGSGLQSVLQAAMQVGTGGHELVIAGGAESMSNVPFYSTEMRWGVKGPGVILHDRLARGRVTAGGRDYPVPGGMLETAENLRREYGISRAEQDRLALASHQRAVAAQRSGVFAEEIVPVTIKTRTGEEVVGTDEHPRANASLEALAGLRPVLGRQDPEATVTAGNASGQTDAAAMCVVTRRCASAAARAWPRSSSEPAETGVQPERSRERLTWAPMASVSAPRAGTRRVTAGQPRASAGGSSAGTGPTGVSTCRHRPRAASCSCPARSRTPFRWALPIPAASARTWISARSRCAHQSRSTWSSSARCRTRSWLCAYRGSRARSGRPSRSSASRRHSRSLVVPRTAVCWSAVG